MTKRLNKQVKIYFIKTTLKNLLNIELKNLNKLSIDEIDRLILDFKIPINNLDNINNMMTTVDELSEINN
jgi:hypothetical protein|tara:strand:- start:6656 stop:6865 length:210 start_codon:yes stop_codon:yes gene_type:complete